MLDKFYHSTIRKSIIAFGTLFNNMFIDRKDSNGDAVQTLKIPLSYSPKQKFLARIAAVPESDTKKDVQIILPRMAFEMLSIGYDPGRRVSYVQQNRVINNTNTTLDRQYAPSPYNIEVSMYIYVKNQDDGLQILEQILPYFNPDFNLTVNAIPQLGIKNDLPILLNNISYEDQYEGDFIERRAIVWTLDFTLKLNFYGPITKQGFIKTAKVNTYDDPELQNRITRYSVTAKGKDEIQELGNDGNHVKDSVKFGNYSYRIGFSNTSSLVNTTTTASGNVNFTQTISFFLKLSNTNPTSETTIIELPNFHDGTAGKGIGIGTDNKIYFDAVNGSDEYQRVFQDSPTTLNDGLYHFVQISRLVLGSGYTTHRYSMIIDGSPAGASNSNLTTTRNNSATNSLFVSSSGGKVNVLNTNNSSNIFIDDLLVTEAYKDYFKLSTPTEARSNTTANAIIYNGFELGTIGVPTEANVGNVTQFIETFTDF